MKRNYVLFGFVLFAFSGSFLFQNCAKMEAATIEDAINATSQASQEEEQLPPDFISNRAIEFDNKDVGNSENTTYFWSLGSSDIFYYETDYRATYKSTLVTITGKNSTPYFQVSADSCEAELALTEEEAQTISGLYANNLVYTEVRAERLSGEGQGEGCAFPRMAFDGKLSQGGLEPTDFDIYFATESCAPAGELYVTDRDGNDPTSARDQVDAFFNSKIDEVCGF